MKKVGGLTLLKWIGKGATSNVYFGTCKRYQEEVAIKVISKHQNKDSVVNEIKMLRQLSGRFLVQFRRTVDRPDAIYIVLEYCRGGDLHSYPIEQGIGSGREEEQW